MGPAEPDASVRPQVHFQVHLLGLDHFPADCEDATPGPQCGGLDLGQVDGQHPPDEEGGGALPGEPGHPQAAQQGGMELHLQGDGDIFCGKEFHRQLPVARDGPPGAPIHDSKEALRFRAVCDERITLPLASLKAFNSVYTKLAAGLSKSSMVEVKVNWRCNVVQLGRAGPAGGGGGPVRQVGLLPGPHPAAGLLPPLEWRWPWGGSGQGGGPQGQGPGGGRHHAPRTRPGHQAIFNKHFPKETKHVFWASVECGLVLPSISAWEVVSKEKFKTTGGYMCRFCKGFWKASRGGTRLLQITGWHKDKATCLQLVMDEPSKQLYNQWIRDRMEFYKKVEPTEPPRDERLVLGDASAPRMRFSSAILKGGSR